MDFLSSSPEERSPHMQGAVCVSEILDGRMDIRTDSRMTHQGFGIGVSFLIQKNLGNFVMAAVGRYVEGSQVVVGDIVHRHVVLQEELDAV